jgi:hypothetical protein
LGKNLNSSYLEAGIQFDPAGKQKDLRLLNVQKAKLSTHHSKSISVSNIAASSKLGRPSRPLKQGNLADRSVNSELYVKQNPVTISSIKNVQLRTKKEQQKKVTEFCLHGLMDNRWRMLHNDVDTKE